MKKTALFSLLLITVLIIHAQKAEAYSVTLKDFEGRDTEVTLDITQTSTSKVQVNAHVSSGIADIQGLFFNFTDIFDANDLQVVGNNVTASVYNNNAINEINVAEETGKKKSNNNITMSGTKTLFDLGLAIGTSGIGKDDIQSTSFTIESLSGKAVAFVDDFGARLTSVGINREESRKLVGSYTPTVVPPTAVLEPTTLMLVGVGILGLFGLRKKMIR